MRDPWKLSRLYFVVGQSPGQGFFNAMVSSVAQLGTIFRCLSCGASHALSVPKFSTTASSTSSFSTFSSTSSAPTSLPSSTLNSFLPAPTFSQYAALRRDFHSSGLAFSSAKTKSDAATEIESQNNVKLENVSIDKIGKDYESRSKGDESIEVSRQSKTPTSKPPPEGEIGFVEGTIDQVRLIDVKERQSRVDDASKTSAKKKEKKKSSDLIAMEKFGVIVPGEKGEVVSFEDPMRSFLLIDDDQSILAPPDEAAELRRKPTLKQKDTLDLTRKEKGMQIGDRAKPSELNFSLRHALFEEAAQMEGGKTKRSFEMAIQMFNKVDPKYKRGHVEMIYQATNLMKEYDLHQDLDAYRMVFDLFPKGVLIPKGILQAGFFHYPRQQDCALEVMVQMERNRVMPDKEFGKQLLEIFGRRSRPHQKYRRMTYWMPKFRYASPFPLIPMNIEKEDGLTAAERLLERICVDLENQITVFRIQPPEDQDLDPFTSASLPWVASAMSPKQHELVAQLPVGKPVYVKGPFPVYLRGRKVEHFTLWAELPDHLKRHYAEEEELFEDYMRQSKDIDELIESDITRQAFRGNNRKNVLACRPSLHEQEDGIVLALSVLEIFSKELLTAWIKNLEASNPHLSQVPVIFSLSSAPPTDLVVQRDETDSAIARS